MPSGSRSPLHQLSPYAGTRSSSSQGFNLSQNLKGNTLVAAYTTTHQFNPLKESSSTKCQSMLQEVGDEPRSIGLPRRTAASRVLENCRNFAGKPELSNFIGELLPYSFAAGGFARGPLIPENQRKRRNFGDRIRALIDWGKHLLCIVFAVLGKPKKLGRGCC